MKVSLKLRTVLSEVGSRRFFHNYMEILHVIFFVMLHKSYLYLHSFYLPFFIIETNQNSNCCIVIRKNKLRTTAFIKKLKIEPIQYIFEEAQLRYFKEIIRNR